MPSAFCFIALYALTDPGSGGTIDQSDTPNNGPAVGAILMEISSSFCPI